MTRAQVLRDARRAGQIAAVWDAVILAAFGAVVFIVALAA